MYNYLLSGHLNQLAEIIHGFVGADIAALCREAAMNVLRRLLPDIKLGEKEEIDNRRQGNI